MKFVRGFEGDIPVIKITLTLDEGRALLKQGRNTWLWKRFVQLVGDFVC